MYNNREYNGTHITTNTDTVVFTGKGILQAVTVNTAAAGAVTIADGVSASTGTTKAILKSSVAEGTYWYNMTMASGLVITTAASTDLTVTWTKG